MSNYLKEGWCRFCHELVEHVFLDNTPYGHHYTVECSICKKRTLLEKWEAEDRKHIKAEGERLFKDKQKSLNF
jgi:hypothetical protein